MEPLFTMLDQAADGALAVDEGQRIVYWNQAAQDLLGFAPDEVLGRPCYEVLRGRNDQERGLCRQNCYVHATSRAGEGVSHFNLLVRSKRGDLRWLNVSILAGSDPGEGTSFLAVHLFRDATQSKQQEQFAQQILDAAHLLQQSLSPNGQASPDEPAGANLTDREFEVLTLLAQGLSTAQIAKALSIAPTTTRNHIQNILQKFQVHSRSAAVAYAFEQGIVARE